MKYDENEVSLLLDKDFEDLLEEFGRGLNNLRLGARPPSRDKSIELARIWLREKKIELCKSLNRSEVIVEYTRNEKGVGRVELFAAIADCISLMLGAPCVVVCSVIILKHGVKEICPDIGNS